MADNNSIEANIEFPNNTGPLLGGVQQVASVTNQIRADFEAMSDSLESLSDRTSKLKGYWDDVLSTIEAAKSAVQVMSTVEQANQTTLNSTMQLVNEILNSVKGLGGNINNAMNLVGMAGGYTGGVANSATASQDFSGRVGVSTGYDQLTLSNSMSAGGQTQYREFVKGTRNAGTTPIVVPAPGGPTLPPPPGGLPPVGGSDAGEPFGSRRTPDSGGAGSETFRGWGVSGASTPTGDNQSNILSDLEANYPHLYNLNKRLNGGIIPSGKEGRSASLSYQYAMKTMNRTFGRIPFIGKNLMDAVSNSLELGGVDPDTIRRSEMNNTNTYYNPTTGERFTTRTGGIPEEGPERSALKVADKVAQIFGSKIVEGFTKFTGYAGIAAQLAYGTVGIMRQFTGISQAQGAAYGETDNGRTASNMWSALTRSDFGLNPNFSFQDVMQNQTNGASMGLRGNQLNQYVGLALQAQGQFGMSAQQSQQYFGAGLGVGVNVQSMAQMLRITKKLENDTTTSAAYNTYATQQALSQVMGIGATQAAGAKLGANANAYGSILGNNNPLTLVAQTAGLTGTELFGTQLGNALMARSSIGGSTNYMNLYAKMQSMSPTQVNQLRNQSNMQILQMLGINTSLTGAALTQELNAKAMILAAALPQMGITDVTTPQQAVAWAEASIAQDQGNKTFGAQSTSPGPTTLTSKQVEAVNKADANFMGVDPTDGGYVPYTVNKNANQNSQIAIQTATGYGRGGAPRPIYSDFGTSPTETTSQLNALKQKLSQNSYTQAGVKASQNVITTAQKDINSGNYAQAVQIIVSFDQTASKYLKAHTKASTNGAGRTNG